MILSLGILGGITMTVLSAVWYLLYANVPEGYASIVHFLRLGANFGSGLVIGVLIHNLKELSTRDALTKVYNRNYVIPQLGRHLALSKRHGHPLSVVVIDLDEFKSYNDTFGHLAGDKLLRTLACQLSNMVRNSDVVARFGGDEFLLLLPHTDGPSAISLLQRVKADLQLNDGLAVTISAGIASFPQDGATPEMLISKADQALYREKFGQCSKDAFTKRLPNG